MGAAALIGCAPVGCAPVTAERGPAGEDGRDGARGERGERGPAGERGPVGAPGSIRALTVYTTENQVHVVPPENPPGNELVVALCDEGDVVISGGCEAPGSDLSSSFPEAWGVPQRWACAVRPRAGEQSSYLITAFAVCLAD